jgi:hypothetical protein
MQTPPRFFPFLLIALFLLAACTAPATLTPPIPATPTPPPTLTPACPPGVNCSPPILTLTAARYTPASGDLGWGQVRGRVIDTISGAPIAGAAVTCTHRSNHPLALCTGAIQTGPDGSFVFSPVFFQTTDYIQLSASHAHYGSTGLIQEHFTHPSLIASFSLPLIDLTPKPCCTAPACRSNEVYSCPGVCPCGCGTTCATKTPTP